ncbi:MAG: hypothetical protein JXR48_10730, partial [Candidatus Delongbacteria bacterium]|nr:hypothetical protein [Candidatus Delongbacteria bacterium]
MLRILFVLLILNSILNGFELKFSDNSVTISGNPIYDITSDVKYSEIKSSMKIMKTKEGYDIPFESYLVVLPSSGNYIVEKISFTTKEVVLDKKLKSEKDEVFTVIDKKNSFVQIADPVIAGGNRFVQVVIYPFDYNESTKILTVKENIQIELKIDYQNNINTLSNRSSRSNSVSRILDKTVSGLP